jgi:catechol 2,3-dioxygenase-like lactoylglutathione lyase family enzyme
MSFSAKHVHTNLVAEDWRALADFYQQLFGCLPVPPERDLQGPQLEAGTGLPGAHLRGIHLRLPGYRDTGPTLEIFNYTHLEGRGARAVNRPGLGHIAFLVDDVATAQNAVIQAGHYANRGWGQSDLVLCNRPGRKYHRVAVVVNNMKFTLYQV